MCLSGRWKVNGMRKKKRNHSKLSPYVSFFFRHRIVVAQVRLATYCPMIVLYWMCYSTSIDRWWFCLTQLNIEQKSKSSFCKINWPTMRKYTHRELCEHGQHLQIIFVEKLSSIKIPYVIHMHLSGSIAMFVRQTCTLCLNKWSIRMHR